MSNEEIYKKAVTQLRDKCGELADRDVIVAVELFDRLLARDKSIDPDTLHDLCRDVGYDEFTSKELSKTYDIVDIYRKYKGGKDIPRWNDGIIDGLLK